MKYVEVIIRVVDETDEVDFGLDKYNPRSYEFVNSDDLKDKILLQLKHEVARYSSALKPEEDSREIYENLTCSSINDLDDIKNKAKEMYKMNIDESWKPYSFFKEVLGIDLINPQDIAKGIEQPKRVSATDNKGLFRRTK